MAIDEGEPASEEVRDRALAKVMAARSHEELLALLRSVEGRERFWVKHYAFGRLYGGGPK
jgi:hypothetical protein